MDRKGSHTRVVAALLFAVVISLLTAGTLHAALHSGEGESADCGACRVADATPLLASLAATPAEPLPLFGIPAVAATEVPEAADLAPVAPRAPPAHG